MSNHKHRFIDQQKPEIPEIYDQELEPPPTLPLRPLITIYAVWIALSFLLIILKQTDQINWSWWLISLPLWLLPTGFVFLAILVLLVAVWHEFKMAFRIR